MVLDWSIYYLLIRTIVRLWGFTILCNLLIKQLQGEKYEFKQNLQL